MCVMCNDYLLKVVPGGGFFWISTVECHELGQKIRILGQGQEQDSSVD